VRPPLSEALRLLWGLLLLLALAASPLLVLILLAIIVVFLHPFRRREYGHPSVTLKGELVRSRSERAIADWFCRNGVRYVYERPAFDRRGSVISRPDFYLPDYGVYVEYWGLAGTGKEYDRTMRWKKAQYRVNEVRVVSLYPGELADLDGTLGARLASHSYSSPNRSMWTGSGP
jgi:hypothetical protein